MSLAFESPTRRAANEAYFTPLNMPTLLTEETVPSTTTPYFTAPINPILHQEFLNAIHSRHASQPTVLTESTPRLTLNPAALSNKRKAPTINLHSTPPPPAAKVTGSAATLPPVTAQELLQWMNDATKLLLLDVRSFVQYSHAQLTTSVNVSIPNTILKRPTFTLDKVYEVITEQDKQRLETWKQVERIVFYDQSSNTLPENSAAIFLTAKFKQAGYKRDMYYLKGGFECFFAQNPQHCTTTPLPKNSRALSGSLPMGFAQPTGLTQPMALGTPALQPRRRPNLNLNCLPAPSLGPFTAPMPQFENQAFNPFFSNIRQNMELSHGPIRERFPVRLPVGCNIDPSTGKVTLQGQQPRHIAGSQLEQLHTLLSAPAWLRAVVVQDPSSEKTGAQCLAEMYEKLERTEQRRLQNIMLFHSKHTNTSAEFPLSIVAGIEMGALNRYTNIWPFEYTRVKIKVSATGTTDYINASYIQYVPTCEETSRPEQVSQASLQAMTAPSTATPYRRYISTQGPLPATFADFWQVVWEQNSRVLVMLTKEEEMNKVKCHRYWPCQKTHSIQYGGMTVTFLSETHHPVASETAHSDDCMIVRQFSLLQQSTGASRTVTHLQYTGWMDFGVPDNPLGTLKVIHAADEAQLHYEAEASHVSETPVGPMIVHCSAGCGRSGAFCVIDTALRRIGRQEHPTGTTDLLMETIACYREQRLSMVQTLRQFIFCYEAVWWWMLGHGHTPASAS
ncbi:protein-tyrosine phosphatase-like protein [Spinellus fusiger]|nr:protein-tyrosine phosphatase-like protein [Spinellus fusiger]